LVAIAWFKKNSVATDNKSLASALGKGRERSLWQIASILMRKAEFDCQVATLNITGLSQPFAECCHIVCGSRRSAYVEISDHRYRGLLRAHRERPRGRTAE
jgi:hypothetical protein